jgi:hypothetical protein
MERRTREELFLFIWSDWGRKKDILTQIGRSNIWNYSKLSDISGSRYFLEVIHNIYLLNTSLGCYNKKVMSIKYKFLKYDRGVFYSIFLLSFAFLFLVTLPITTHASIYAPGETLEPDCVAGTSNCGVDPSLGLTLSAINSILNSATSLLILELEQLHLLPNSLLLAMGIFLVG